jgi:hypothetical protein
MKIAFNTILIFSLLLETMAALSLIGGPQGISAAGSGGMWSMHYGFAALSIASASLWVWPHRTNLKAVTAVLGILMTFHTGLVISLALAGDQMFGLIAHSIVASSCIILFTQRSRWCDDPSAIDVNKQTDTSE